MILKRVVYSNGIVVYVPITLQEASEEDIDNLVFTDDKYKDIYEEYMDFLCKDYKCPYNVEEDPYNIDKDVDYVINNLTQGNYSSNYKKVDNLMRIIPFLSEDDLSELVNKILSNHEEYKDLLISGVMPFLKTVDCDKLFFAMLDGKFEKVDLISVVPYISNEALNKFVDYYVKGRYEFVNINIILPYLSSKDVKKIFNYALKKNYEKEDR